MSDRRRRSEASWNMKEDKSSSRWSNSEVNEDMMPSNHSGRSSWDPLQGNKNRPKGDDISRDRHRMQTDPSIYEWGKHYSTRPSHDSYDLSYRSRDRGVSDSMSRDRDRPKSPYRSRNMSRSRSRSRSRNRDWESARTRSRSPLCDDDRYRDESNEYPNIRYSSRLSSRPSKDFASRRGGGVIQVDNNNMKDSRRPGGSRDDDYHYDDRDNWNRNTYDDQDPRRQSHQNSRAIPCRYFSAGKCNRDDCKFSHDSGSLVNKNSRWHDQQAHGDLNPKPNFGEKKKPWDGPSWDDVDSVGFDNIQGHTLDDKSRSWDDKSRSWDDKKKLPDGPSWDDVRKSDSNFDIKNRSWNNSSRDGASGYSDSNKTWNNNASGIMNEKTGGKTKKWNGPSWDEVSESGYSDVGKSSGGDMTCSVMLPQTDNKIRKWNNNASGTMSEKTGGKIKKWNGPLWDEVSESGHSDVGKSSGGDMTCSVMLPQTDNKIRKWDCPELNEMASEKYDHLLPQRTNITGLQSHTLDVQEQHVMPKSLGGRYAKASTTLTPEVFVASSDLDNANIISQYPNHQILSCGKDSINDMNSQSLSYSNGTEQSHHMLPFSGPKIQLNKEVEGTFLHTKETENKNEGGKPLKPSEIDIPQGKHEVNALPVSLPAMSPKGQLPQLYTELNLSNAIDFLKSLPTSAYNQDTKPIEKVNSGGESMDIKTSLPIMSGSERQENQVFPPVLTDGPTSTTEVGETCFIEKSPKIKNQELIGNPEGSLIRVAESANQEQEIINPEKVEEGDITNDEKAMRLFKVALVEFVKEILKPKWKEGKMSRDVHKNVVKKVVEKVTSTIHGIQIPRTQAKIDHYLACSKPKITKLVEAYVERLLKA